MKPTPQISYQPVRQNLPLTDYHYQSTLEAASTTVEERRDAQRLHGFWTLSAGFFGAEAKLDYATELLFFCFITTLSAWPIVSAFVAVTRMVRNY